MRKLIACVTFALALLWVPASGYAQPHSDAQDQSGPEATSYAEREFSEAASLIEAQAFHAAQVRLHRFLEQHPGHGRTGEALYLLGVTYLRVGKPRQAATWFYESYQRYGGGEKAPESLLSLALAMRQMGDGARLCIALREYNTKFTTVSSYSRDQLYKEAIGDHRCELESGAPPGNASDVVHLMESGGTYKVPATINGVLQLHFMIDSGASDVVIPADVVLTLMRTGTILDSDFVGHQSYRLADGSVMRSETFLIRTLTVGNHTIENVLGSVGKVEGSLLLGQSFLSRFSKVSFDYDRSVLLLE